MYFCHRSFVSPFWSDLSFLPRPAMVWCERGIQVLLTTMGAFAAFALMTVAIGTDYWLYARAFICNSTANSTQEDSNNKDKKDPGALTHSGLWRICCLEGTSGCSINIHAHIHMCVWCVCVCVSSCLAEVSIVIITDVNRCSFTYKH